ncbi:hypothetical protein KM043_009628 [Ampulex compressa]|nr:hypothetical protein KM043_009628 [Ampulex compressa]
MVNTRRARRDQVTWKRKVHRHTYRDKGGYTAKNKKRTKTKENTTLLHSAVSSCRCNVIIVTKITRLQSGAWRKSSSPITYWANDEVKLGTYSTYKTNNQED